MHLKEEAKETIVFVEMFDKFFDMLNVTNYTKCITKRKHFQRPYTLSKDIRLEVCIINANIDIRVNKIITVA